MKELIERYLKNLMNAEEKSAFIGQLQQDEALQQEVRMVKMAIMLEAVLNAELQEEENVNMLIAPIPNEKDNGNGKYNDFFPFWVLGIAASFLIVIVYFFGEPRLIEQAYYKEGGNNKPNKYLLDLMKDIVRTNQETSTDNPLASQHSSKNKKKLSYVSRSNGVQAGDSLSSIAPVNGGTRKGLGVFPRVSAFFSINYEDLCPLDTFRFCNISNNFSNLHWDFGSGFDSTFNNDLSRCRNMDSLVFELVYLNSTGSCGVDSNELNIGVFDGSVARCIAAEGINQYYILAQKRLSIYLDLETLASVATAIDSVNGSDSLKIKTMYVAKSSRYPHFYNTKKRINKHENACESFFEFHEPSEERKIDREHQMRAFPRKPFLRLRLFGKVYHGKKRITSIWPSVPSTQAKKTNQLYLSSLQAMKLHQYKSAEKQLIQLLKLQKTEKVRSLGWTEEDLQWRILLVKLAQGKLDRNSFLDILNDEQHKYHADADDLFQKLSAHLTWKGRDRGDFYHQN